MVSPKFTGWSPKPNMMAFGDEGLGEVIWFGESWGWGPHGGVSTFPRRDTGCLFSLSTPWGHSDKAGLCKAGRGSSPEPNHANTITSDFQPLELWFPAGKEVWSVIVKKWCPVSIPNGIKHLLNILVNELAGMEAPCLLRSSRIAHGISPPRVTSWCSCSWGRFLGFDNPRTPFDLKHSAARRKIWLH